MIDLRSLADRLEKRAKAEREIAENNSVVANLLEPEIKRFDRLEQPWNVYAVRMAIEHRNNAVKDAAFADDLMAAVDIVRQHIDPARASHSSAANDARFFFPDNPRYNPEPHGRKKVVIPPGMTEWRGGRAAPADWDGGPVLFRSGKLFGAPVGHVWKLGWDHSYGDGDVIAYTKKVDQDA